MEPQPPPPGKTPSSLPETHVSPTKPQVIKKGGFKLNIPIRQKTPQKGGARKPSDAVPARAAAQASAAGMDLPSAPAQPSGVEPPAPASVAQPAATPPPQPQPTQPAATGLPQTAPARPDAARDSVTPPGFPPGWECVSQSSAARSAPARASAAAPDTGPPSLPPGMAPARDGARPAQVDSGLPRSSRRSGSRSPVGGSRSCSMDRSQLEAARSRDRSRSRDDRRRDSGGGGDQDPSRSPDQRRHSGRSRSPDRRGSERRPSPRRSSERGRSERGDRYGRSSQMRSRSRSRSPYHRRSTPKRDRSRSGGRSEGRRRDDPAPSRRRGDVPPARRQREPSSGRDRGHRDRSPDRRPDRAESQNQASAPRERSSVVRGADRLLARAPTIVHRDPAAVERRAGPHRADRGEPALRPEEPRRDRAAPPARHASPEDPVFLPPLPRAENEAAEGPSPPSARPLREWGPNAAAYSGHPRHPGEEMSRATSALLAPPSPRVDNSLKKLCQGQGLEYARAPASQLASMLLVLNERLAEQSAAESWDAQEEECQALLLAAGLVVKPLPGTSAAPPFTGEAWRHSVPESELVCEEGEAPCALPYSPAAGRRVVDPRRAHAGEYAALGAWVHTLPPPAFALGEESGADSPRSWAASPPRPGPLGAAEQRIPVPDEGGAGGGTGGLGLLDVPAAPRHVDAYGASSASPPPLPPPGGPRLIPPEEGYWQALGVPGSMLGAPAQLDQLRDAARAKKLRWGCPVYREGDGVWLQLREEAFTAEEVGWPGAAMLEPPNAAVPGWLPPAGDGDGAGPGDDGAAPGLRAWLGAEARKSREALAAAARSVPLLTRATPTPDAGKFRPVPSSAGEAATLAATRRWLECVGPAACAAVAAARETSHKPLRRRWGGGAGLAAPAAVRGALMKEAAGVRNAAHEVLNSVLMAVLQGHAGGGKGEAAARTAGNPRAGLRGGA
ncbi:hypothetical protein ACKKBF_B33500 [Auxenochlorella protothecoides x Auxenochlorella symbiontica]